MKRALIWCAVGLGLGIVLTVLVNTALKAKPSTAITSTTLKNSLVQAQDLTTTKYTYSKVGKFENSKEINGWTIPFTTKNFLLTYQGEVNLGVDLSKADVNMSFGTVRVHCPALSILSNTIDEKTIEVYDQSMNPLNQISVSDFVEFSIYQKAAAIEEMQKQGVFEKAQEDAKTAITQLLNMIPEVSEGYSIEVTFDEMPDYAAEYAPKEEEKTPDSSKTDSSKTEEKTEAQPVQ